MNKKFYRWKWGLVTNQRFNIAYCIAPSDRAYVQPDDGLEKSWNM